MHRVRLGGTDSSKHFANNYRFFSENAGLHPFSAEESRAVAEFVSTHEHIAAVYVLGMQDNLIKPREGRRVPGIGGASRGRTGVSKALRGRRGKVECGLRPCNQLSR